jgi:chemotaxis protein MotA
MNKTTILGLLVGLVAVLGGAMLDGTPFSSLINVPAFVVVIVGTVGATALSYPVEDLLRVPGLLRRVLLEGRPNSGAIVETFVDLATRARRDGLLSLESEAGKAGDPFLQRGIQLVVDGTDEALIKGILEGDIESTSARHASGYALFDTMGGFSPTLGIMGAVLGLIHVLSQVDDPTKLAAGIATAFVATLYGVGSANLVFFPFANKLRLQSENEEHLHRLMVRGILAIHAGDNPRIVRQKLETFLAPEHRGRLAEKPAGTSASDATAAAAGARR